MLRTSTGDMKLKPRLLASLEIWISREQAPERDINSQATSAPTHSQSIGVFNMPEGSENRSNLLFRS